MILFKYISILTKTNKQHYHIPVSNELVYTGALVATLSIHFATSINCWCFTRLEYEKLRFRNRISSENSGLISYKLEKNDEKCEYRCRNGSFLSAMSGMQSCRRVILHVLILIDGQNHSNCLLPNKLMNTPCS